MKGIFNFERKAVFKLTLSCIHGMHQHKSNHDKHSNNQLQKACKRLELFTDVMTMTVDFSPVQSVLSSINKN